MKNILLMAVALLMLEASVTSRAAPENANGFVGLWEAVDIEDGSYLVLSITDNGDGTVKLLLHDTFWNLCNNDKGIGQGEGEVSAEQSLKVDDFTISCFETDSSKTAPTTFTLNSDNTLREGRVTPSFPLVIYHKTSK